MADDGRDVQATEKAEATKPVPAQEPSDFGTLVRNATDRMLVFLSNASNETLGACIIGLGATTYIILGRVGLVLIGFVGGVALHATWEGGASGSRDGQDTASEVNRRKQTGLEVMRRILDWRSKRTPADIEEEEESFPFPSDYSNFRPETASALTSLTDAIIRDYVDYWYGPILPKEVAFPAASRLTLTEFILTFSSHLSRKRPADAFLDFVTNSSSIFIVFLSELSSAFSASPHSTATEAFNVYLREKPECHLATLMDRHTQTVKLGMVADDILEKNLNANTFKCAPARVFLRKMLGNVMLEMTLTSCARPEWINEWIVYLLEEGEPELLNVIDEGLEQKGTPKATKAILATSNSTEKLEQANGDLESNESRPDHRRRVSRAEGAMDEAMQEAKRLTQMIMEEEEKKEKELESANNSVQNDISEANTRGLRTPISSQSDLNGDPNTDQVILRSAESENVNTGDKPAEEPPPAGASANPDQNTPLSSVNTLSRPSESKRGQNEVLTLHRANVSIYNDRNPSDKKTLKSKPTSDFLLQIEPVSSNFPGWMVQRLYADFETLHEVLRRISIISGVRFHEVHNQVPSWKGQSKLDLRDELERYLGDAVSLEPLAESEGMKKFLGKGSTLALETRNKAVFPWANPAALENVGKGVLDVFSKAPKGVVGGGKAMFGGVSNVLGGVTNPNAKKMALGAAKPGGASNAKLGSESPATSCMNEDLIRRQSTSQENQNQRLSLHTQTSSGSLAARVNASLINFPSKLAFPVETSDWNDNSPTPSPSPPDEMSSYLPPPPSDIPDDYNTLSLSSPNADPVPKETMNGAVVPPSIDGTDSSLKPLDNDALETRLKSQQRVQSPMTEEEAQVTIELLFAVINQLYTLSSAWQIRKTLLTAARSFLLRPGSPQLESMRLLVQESVLEANTSDTGMANLINKLRANSVPTEDELKNWPAPRSDAEKEALRTKARRLLIQRGMPQALTSVMGYAAGAEALGKVFDCLQVEDIARGLIFGLLLQVARIAVQ